MMFSKDVLDVSICDVVKGSRQELTLREFILKKEHELELEYQDLDVMTDLELNDYLDYLHTYWIRETELIKTFEIIDTLDI